MAAALSPGRRAVPSSHRGRQLKTFARVSAIGIELSLSVVIGLLGGRFLDEKLSTDPYLTIVGLLLGVTAGFKSLYQTAKKATQQQREEPADSQEPPRDD
jgi:ATP synthase protein I